MSQADALIRKKVKDESEGILQANRVRDFLEESDFCYDLGAAGPFFQGLRRHLTEKIGFYERHRNPDSNLRNQAKIELRLANKMVVGALIKGLNKLLEASSRPIIVLPTSIKDLERVCHKLFHYAGEPTNVGEPQGSGGAEDGTKDTRPLPMA